MARSPRWGWHQLRPSAARRLVADAQLPRHALVLDVGAGHGAITRPLIDAGARVVAIELHPRRARELEDRFAGAATIVRADASDLRLPRRPFHVVANPPYSVLSSVMRRLLHPGSRLQSAHLVLPVWAVRRWTARNAPGINRWTTTFDVTPGRFVPRRTFLPAPPTDARVLVIHRR